LYRERDGTYITTASAIQSGLAMTRVDVNPPTNQTPQ
jgi:hypothetical protein